MSDDWVLVEYTDTPPRAVFARRAVQDGQEGWEIKTEYYVDPTIEANKTEFNNQAQGWKGDYHKIASLSPSLAYGDSYIANALREGDERAISKWMNDADNRHWRTKGGNV